jgi:hypothetical protein
MLKLKHAHSANRSLASSRFLIKKLRRITISAFQCSSENKFSKNDAIIIDRIQIHPL